MENPATWGLAERVISDARAEWHRAGRMGVYGPSLPRAVADALRKAGLLAEEPGRPWQQTVALLRAYRSDHHLSQDEAQAFRYVENVLAESREPDARPRPEPPLPMSTLHDPADRYYSTERPR